MVTRRVKYKYGWGDCSHCGRDVAATKNGLAVRHGYIRRVILPKLIGGHDYYSCEGSGKLLDNWYNPNVKGKL